jgi:hypothetical protein
MFILFPVKLFADIVKTVPEAKIIYFIISKASQY